MVSIHKLSSALGLASAGLTILTGITTFRHMIHPELGIALMLAGVGMAVVAYGIYAEPRYHRFLGLLMFGASFIPAFYLQGMAFLTVLLGISSGIAAILWSGPPEEEHVGEHAGHHHEHQQDGDDAIRLHPPAH